MAQYKWLGLAALLLILGTGIWLVGNQKRAKRDTPSASSGSATKPAAQGTPLRVAFNTWIGYSSFYLAEESGCFRKEGINIETKVIDPLAEKNAAILRGDLDAMGGTIDSTIVTAASGVKGRVVYMFDRSNGTDGILVSDKVKTTGDLRKVKIALEEGFVGHFFLLYYLEKEHVSTEGLSIVPMTTDAAGAAFAAGKVDAAVTWEPYLSTAQKRPGSRVLVSSAQLEPILADTLFVSEQVLEKRRDEVVRLVSCLQQGNDYWLEHSSEANAIVARRWQMSESDVAAIMQTDQLYKAADQRAHFGANNTDGDLYRYLGEAARLWYQSGVVDKEVDAATLIDGFAVRGLEGY